MANYLDNDNYPNFGNRIIPGLKKDKLRYPKNSLGSNIQLFTDGQYEKGGINGAYAGIRGQVSLYNGGDLELYGGAGNIAAAGLKYSHTFYQRDNLSFKGYARAEGALSLTNKKEFSPIDYNVNIETTANSDSNINAEYSGDITPTWSIIPDNDMLYHHTDIKNQWELDIQHNANLTGEMPLSNFKTAIGGEMTFTNDKGNLEIGLGGEIGVKGKSSGKSEFSQWQIEQHTTLNSAECNSDIVWENMNSNLQSNESLTINNRINIGGFETKVGVDPKLYGALNGKLNYRVGKFGVNLGAGIDYSDKTITPNFKAGITYMLGDSPIIHKHGARVLFKKNPLSGDGVFLDTLSPEATLKLFTEGKATDGINGLAVGLEGNIPLNNIGTDLNIRAGIGNYVTADFNISQTNPIHNNNIKLIGRIGGAIDYSLTKKNIYESKEVLAENENDYYVEHSSINSYTPDYDYPQIAQYTINEQNQIVQVNKAIVNANSIKAYGSLAVAYNKNNLTLKAEIEGGYRTIREPFDVSHENTQFDASAGYTAQNYQPESGNLPDPPAGNGNGYYWHMSNYYNDNHELAAQNIQVGSIVPNPTSGYPYTGLYMNNTLEGNSRIGFNGNSSSHVSFIPKFKPYLKGKFSGTYDFDNKNSITGEINYDGNLGGLVTYTRRLR